MNTISAVITKGSHHVVTLPLWQYDYGQVLTISGVELPNSYEVHFGNSESGNSTTALGDANGVSIPDIYLTSGEDVHAWLYLHTSENDGETVYHITIPVRKRAKVTNAQPTPVQQDVITQTIAALDAAVEGVPASIDAALAEAKASGEFDGKDGADGQDGKDGQDGHSPVVTATKSNGVTTVSVDGEPIATINDGTDGQDGQNGQNGQNGSDGYSPTATVSKSGGTATISITDKNGTTTAQVSDGQNGQDGQDGQPGVGIPAGGTDGQMLVKDGATDYATKWVNRKAAWELIREDTVTNATEAGIEITVDGNGNAFKLTDVVLMFETPQQANEAKKAGYGAYYFYYKDTNSNLAGLSGTWTQAANAAANGCVIHVENNDDMIFVTSQSYSSSGNANNLRRLYKEGFSGSQQSVQLISDFYVHKVTIPGVTGTGHYKLYGKRR